MSSKILIEEAEKKDVPLILSFIKKLAGYEKLSDKVEATEELLEKYLFGSDANARALIGYFDGKPTGFAVYFYNFSTFLGKKGIYLEDIFILPEMRGRGFGRAFIKHIAEIAVKENCGRFEWSVLDWNEPSRKFYENLGARPMDEWIIYRLEGKEILKLAQNHEGDNFEN